MKPFLPAWQRLLGKLRVRLLFKTTPAQRGMLGNEARELEASEAERLDRLRNPGNYRCR
jgi:hypothetical protein